MSSRASLTRRRETIDIRHIKAIARIVKTGGNAISCACSSGGIGKQNRFESDRILLYAHGAHNDTIITVETKRLTQ